MSLFFQWFYDVFLWHAKVNVMRCFSRCWKICVCVCICCSSFRTGCLVKVTVIFRRQHNCKNQKGVAREWILCLLGCSFYWWCLCQTERTLVRVRLDTMRRVALEVIILLLLLSFNCLLVGRVVLSDRIRWIVFVSLHSHFSLFVSVRLFNEIFS